MFGYVYIHKPELKVKEYELYRGVYCSLCKSLGKNYSVFARFILNYDCTFLSLFIMSRQSSCPDFKEGRCRFNPTKKCNYAKGSKEALDKGAALTVITSYYKLLDSIEDSSFFKKIGYSLLRPFFSAWHKKAKKHYPQYEEAVKEMFYSQLNCEKSSDVCLDMAAEPTAVMLEKVLLQEANNDEEKQIFSQLGYHLGRWIYLMDAAADVFDDAKKKNFNPFILKYKDACEIKWDEIDSLLNHSRCFLGSAYNLLNKTRFSSILDNILYDGLENKQKKVLFPEEK